MLTEEAKHLWDNAREHLENTRTIITWAVYRDIFLVKYFFEDIFNRKKIEIVKLEHGNISVAEYATKFEEFSK